MKPCSRLPLAMAAGAMLSACAATAPLDVPSTARLPPQWQAPLPHAGRLADLRVWWQQFDDPLLSSLIDSAQDASPTLASARSRIAQARAARVAAGAALLPTLDASIGASRSRQDLGLPAGNSANVGFQTAWEIDLFGANRAGRNAAQARLDGAATAWHDARITVAAEVGDSYSSLRACEARIRQTEFDAASRDETARLTELAARAGFQPPASASLARASAAQGRSLVTQQRASCELLVKSLVELTGADESALRGQLAAGVARQPQPAQLSVPEVPAEVLAQRPDLATAASEVIAAGAEVSQAQAQRYPRIGLAGSIGATRFESGPIRLDGTVWSVGPVSVSLPLFDGATRSANVDAARARSVEAGALYRARLRFAVREVESALVTLQSTADRSDDAQVAVEGFAVSLRATEESYRGGLANLFELEDARRSAVAAQVAMIDLQRERVAAWIALYRALGGGWSAGTELPAEATDGAGGTAAADRPATAAAVGVAAESVLR